MSEPLSLDPLWNVCFVADSFDEAMKQAWKQYDAYDGKVVLVHSLMAWRDDDGENVEMDFTPPIPVRVVGAFSDAWDWTGDDMIPEWWVAPITGHDRVVDTKGVGWNLSTMRDLTYFAPAVGTRAGFAGTREREFIEVDQAWSPE